ncbi:MAG: hypothetical protein JSV67_00495 [Thermoplasmatales archaeon]|nr:MAG: hypothetical protein JSV67_00495 [Thermoplasmatales archaeon]
MPKYSLEDSILLYKSVAPRNADYLFPWLYSVYDNTYLPSIDINFKHVLSLDKTKLTIFDVLVDDLADNAKLRDRRLLEEAIRIPWNGNKKSNDPYIIVTKKIWIDCIESIRNYPRFDEFKDIFYFDLDQVMNSMRYSYLVNTSDFSSMIEDELYLNHGVMVILHCDMDLMCSPNFNFEELKKLRPILHWVQDVAHIGNLLNTYPKEIQEADFSSPIISLGVREGLIDKSTIINDPEYAKANLLPLVSRFEQKMIDNLEKIKNNAVSIKSINLIDFYNRLKEVWEAFLNREQYWDSIDKYKEKEELFISKKINNNKLKWIRM